MLNRMLSTTLKLVFPEATEIRARLGVKTKAPRRLVMPAPMVTSSRYGQFSKTKSPTFVTLSGKVKEVI